MRANQTFYGVEGIEVDEIDGDAYEKGLDGLPSKGANGKRKVRARAHSEESSLRKDGASEFDMAETAVRTSGCGQIFGVVTVLTVHREGNNVGGWRKNRRGPARSLGRTGRFTPDRRIPD